MLGGAEDGLTPLLPFQLFSSDLMLTNIAKSRAINVKVHAQLQYKKVKKVHIPAVYLPHYTAPLVRNIILVLHMVQVL